MGLVEWLCHKLHIGPSRREQEIEDTLFNSVHATNVMETRLEQLKKEDRPFDWVHRMRNEEFRRRIREGDTE